MFPDTRKIEEEALLAWLCPGRRPVGRPLLLYWSVLCLLPVLLAAQRDPYKSVQELLAQGDIVRAEIAVGALLDTAETDPARLHALGLAFAGKDRFKTAARIFERVVRSAPSYDAFFNLALVLGNAGDHEGAIEVLERMIKAGIVSGEVYNLLGQNYETSSRPFAAVEAYQSAVKLDPGREPLYYDLTRLLAQNRTYEPAEAIFRAALERFPESSRLRELAGIVLQLEGKFKEAEQMYRSAWEKDGACGECLTLLARCYYENGEFSECLKLLDKERLFESSSANRLIYAQALEKLNAPLIQVEEQLRQAIEMNPRLAEAHVMLGKVLISRQEYSRARDLLNEALRLGLKDPHLHFQLSRALSRIGRPQDAEREMAEFQKLKDQERTQMAERVVQQFRYTIR